MAQLLDRTCEWCGDPLQGPGRFCERCQEILYDRWRDDNDWLFTDTRCAACKSELSEETQQKMAARRSAFCPGCEEAAIKLLRSLRRRGRVPGKIKVELGRAVSGWQTLCRFIGELTTERKS